MTGGGQCVDQKHGTLNYGETFSLALFLRINNSLNFLRTNFIYIYIGNDPKLLKLGDNNDPYRLVDYIVLVFCTVDRLFAGTQMQWVWRLVYI